MNSPFSPSSPTLRWFFMLLAAFSISVLSKGPFIFVGSMVGISSGSVVNISVKYCDMTAICSVSDPAMVLFSFCMMSDFFGSLFFIVRIA